MTQRIEIEQPAGPGERFTQEAFWDQVRHGTTVPLDIEGRHVADAKLVGVKVADDGPSVRLTLEVPDDALPKSLTTPGSFSFGLRD